MLSLALFPRHSLALALLAGAMAMGLAACTQARSDADAAPQPEPQVQVVVAKAQALERTQELPGRVQAWRTAEVRPRVAGIVQKRHFQEGADVRAGQVLYQIDPAPF